MKSRLAMVLVAAGVLAVAGCGGGGGEDLSALNPDRSDPVETVQAWIDLNTKPQYCTPEGAAALWELMSVTADGGELPEVRQEILDAFLAACVFGPPRGVEHWAKIRARPAVENEIGEIFHADTRKRLAEDGHAYVSIELPWYGGYDVIAVYLWRGDDRHYIYPEDLPILLAGEGSATDL